MARENGRDYEETVGYDREHDNYPEYYENSQSKLERGYNDLKTGLAFIGILYLLQLFAVVDSITIAVTEDVQQAIAEDKAGVRKNR